MPHRLIAFVGFLLLALHVPVAADEMQAPDNALLILPQDASGKSGWPSIVLLHGYGTNKEDFLMLGHILSTHGVAVFSVDAPIELGDGRRSWPRDGEQSYGAVKPTLDFIAQDKRFDARRVFAGGFSQGGYHSLLLGKSHPAAIAGLLIISPGGGSALPEGWQGDDVSQPLYVLYGTEEGRGILNLVESSTEAWRAADQRVRVETHPGGHHFPDDWATVLGDAMDWLLEKE